MSVHTDIAIDDALDGPGLPVHGFPVPRPVFRACGSYPYECTRDGVMRRIGTTRVLVGVALPVGDRWVSAERLRTLAWGPR